MALMVALGTAMVGSLFSADVWNNLGFAAAEEKEPHRTVPRAMAFGTILVIMLYVLAKVSYISVLIVLTGMPVYFLWRRQAVHHAEA